ncbi:unnamed protein product [Arabidopsis arenosa]|uniref:RBR-type E3 ubiquitin transferase n=1 Tax=Arabidopsis arenosa TaxID=38785 RepID=A0A8S2AEA4_ARAAE|nr:unnamed protein product [Arabidopsis arenosa]
MEEEGTLGQGDGSYHIYIREQVTGNKTKSVYERAMETVVSEISIHMPASCHICFDDDFKAEQMFSVPLCGHRFCIECVKRHIEARLLEGRVPRCPDYQCESKLTFRSCANLLTPKLKAMWEQRIADELIFVADRIYCPNPRCSALMSVTELSISTQEAKVRRCCVKCSEPFCINCKVPWHSDLSCGDYKRLGPKSTLNDIKLIILANQKLWRQCKKCNNMIERSEGCSKLTCRFSSHSLAVITF